MSRQKHELYLTRNYYVNLKKSNRISGSGINDDSEAFRIERTMLSEKKLNEIVIFWFPDIIAVCIGKSVAR